MRASLRFTGFWIAFTLFDVLVRLPYSTSFWYLNEDAALIDGAMRSLEQHGILHWFFHSYGPKIIRPWQLLSFAIDGHLFYQQPYLSHLFSMGLLGIAQALLCIPLRKQIGSYWALFVVGLIGVGRAGAEPTLWLSDRHDLFLFLFSGAAFASTMKWSEVRSRRESSAHLLLTCVSMWGAFYANEKAVVLPPLLCLAVLFHHLKRKDSLTQTLCSPRYLTFVVVSLVSLTLYFLLRKSVLGVFIGGYNGSIVPDEGIGVRFLFHWLVGILGTPYWQSTSHLLWVFFFASTLFFLVFAAFSFIRRESTSTWLFSFLCGLGAILLASLPTAQFILPFEHLGVFSTRMHWYIFIVWSIVLGYFLSHLKSQMNDRRGLNILLVVFSLVYFSFAFYGGRVAAKQVAAASEFSKAAYEKFTEYCACASTKSPQTVGLPTHYRTVNVYTGEEWLDHVAYFSGLPLCQSERERCEIRYHVRPQAQVSVTAQKISQSILERVHLPEEEDTERLGCFALSKGFPATLKSKKNLRLRGRIIKECDIRGDERFYLLVDGKLLLFADLNMPLRGKAEKEGNVLRGFLFEVPASSLPVGEHEYELVAVSAAKSVHVAKRSVTRARA